MLAFLSSTNLHFQTLKLMETIVPAISLHFDFAFNELAFVSVTQKIYPVINKGDISSCSNFYQIRQASQNGKVQGHGHSSVKNTRKMGK